MKRTVRQAARPWPPAPCETTPRRRQIRAGRAGREQDRTREATPERQDMPRRDVATVAPRVHPQRCVARTWTDTPSEQRATALQTATCLTGSPPWTEGQRPSTHRAAPPPAPPPASPCARPPCTKIRLDTNQKSKNERSCSRVGKRLGTGDDLSQLSRNCLEEEDETKKTKKPKQNGRTAWRCLL
jgi:hypothetical protein